MNVSVNEFKRLIRQKRNDPKVQLFQTIQKHDTSNQRIQVRNIYLAARTRAWRIFYKRLKKYFNLSYLVVFHLKEKSIIRLKLKRMLTHLIDNCTNRYRLIWKLPKNMSKILSRKEKWDQVGLLMVLRCLSLTKKISL